MGVHAMRAPPGDARVWWGVAVRDVQDGRGGRGGACPWACGCPGSSAPEWRLDRAVVQGPRKAGGAAAEGARQEMTGVLMRVLPDALQRHAAEPLVVAHLAACVPCMQLELYSLGQEGDALEALLKSLSAAFFRHAPLHLLQRCSAAITHAVEKGPASLQVGRRAGQAACSTRSPRALLWCRSCPRAAAVKCCSAQWWRF
jgi:hypothetical protein